MNILFFSNNCESSKALISMMQAENLIRFFHMHCTDGNAKNPPQIKVTPTIIIKGVPIPYAAADAFAWFAKIKQWKIDMQMKKVSQAQQQYFQSVGNNLGAKVGETRVLEFSREEMEGLSDMFSYLQDGVDSLPHSFFACEKMGNDKIITPPKEEKPIDIERYKRLGAQVERDRKRQDEAFRSHIDKFKNQFTN